MAIQSVEIATNNSSYDTLLTVPAGKNYAITTIIVCNTYVPNPNDLEEGLSSFDMFLHPAGSVDPIDPTVFSYTSQVIKNLELRAGESFTFDSEKLILGPGDEIRLIGYSSSNGTISATVSWLEM
jgi:hypothetical protein